MRSGWDASQIASRRSRRSEGDARAVVAGDLGEQFARRVVTVVALVESGFGEMRMARAASSSRPPDTTGMLGSCLQDRECGPTDLSRKVRWRGLRSGLRPTDNPPMADVPNPEQLTSEQLLASDFRTAANAVLAFLYGRLGFGLWMVTRVNGDDWIVLEANDHGYDIKNGDVFTWSDSFCSRMVQGQGPRVAYNSDLVPAYVEAPIGQRVPIGAYVGVPIQVGTELFGTLCAINPTPVPESIVHDQPLVELLAGLLGNILLRERAADEARREAERASVDALTDALTGLTNRRGWEELLTKEEQRAERYGDSALAFSIDLDDLKSTNDTAGHAAGDDLLCRAANALRGAVRPTDVVARLGGDEFGIIFVPAQASELEAIRQRVAATLDAAGVNASIGGAVRRPATGLRGAVAEADQQMFAVKSARKSARGGVFV